ncbi:hypothetical protein B0H15DRAFT_799481 [Mycena belliarum]|uniref:Uncharacterized protein n=1 Tax=Mycena belliarum TaxID=1033014 RepID=A0AAD6XSJ3_9AGAR|nr:hypothetical protein B0H15DRAFT_799481 [Mycena belliae]
MTSTTTTPHTSAGKPGLGAKIKGATQMVHGAHRSVNPSQVSCLTSVTGAGENLRGTILGGVDTVAHQDSTRNDAVAAKGRAEHAAGAERMTGDPLAADYYALPGETAPRPQHPVPPTQTQTQTGTGYIGTSGAPANVPVPGTGMGPNSNTSGAAAPPPKQQAYGATDELNRHASDPSGRNSPAGHTYPPLQQNHAFDEHSGLIWTLDAAVATPPPQPSRLDQPFHDHAAAAERIPAYDGPGNDMQAQGQARHERPAGEPQHHRDDAISGAGGLVPTGGPAQGGGAVPPAYERGEAGAGAGAA